MCWIFEGVEVGVREDMCFHIAVNVAVLAVAAIFGKTRGT